MASFEKRSIESPEVPLTAANINEYFGGGSLSDAGERVSEATAMNFTTVRACVAILAESLASLPLKVYRRTPDGGSEVDYNHPVAPLLGEDGPNGEMTDVLHREMEQTHRGIAGNSYGRIERNGSGTIVQIHPEVPQNMKPTRRKSDGSLAYAWRKPARPSYPGSPGQGSEWTVLDPLQVLHVPGLSWNGIEGFSPVAQQRQAIGLGLAVEKFAGKALSNGAWMSFALKHPGKLQDVPYERLKKSIDKRKGGVINANRPIILEDDMDIATLNMPRDDAMFLGLRQFQKREIASWYRIPPHMIADMEKGSSYSSIEQMSIDFVKFTLAIWLKKVRAEYTRKLADPLRERGTRSRWFIDFVVDAFLKGATKERYEAHAIALLNGFKNADEVRALENDPPLPDGKGQVFRAPLNTGPVGEEAGDVDPSEPGSVARAMFGETISLVEATALQLVRVEADRAQRWDRAKNPDDAAEMFLTAQRAHTMARLEPSARTLARQAKLAGLGHGDPEKAARAATRTVVDERIKDVADAFAEARRRGDLAAELEAWKSEGHKRLGKALTSAVLKEIRS